jgi:hypothetical protein
MAYPYPTTRPKGFLTQKKLKNVRKGKYRPGVPAKLPKDPCKVEVNTDVIFQAISRNGVVDWDRVKRVANRYPDDGGMGSVLREFIWDVGRGKSNLRKVANDVRRYQRYACARAGREDIARFKAKFARKQRGR